MLVTGCGGVSGRKSEFSVGLGNVTVGLGCGRSSVRLLMALLGVMPKIFTDGSGWVAERGVAGGTGDVEMTGAGGGVALMLLMTTVFWLPRVTGGSVV